MKKENDLFARIRNVTKEEQGIRSTIKMELHAEEEAHKKNMASIEDKHAPNLKKVIQDRHGIEKELEIEMGNILKSKSIEASSLPKEYKEFITQFFMVIIYKKDPLNTSEDFFFGKKEDRFYSDIKVLLQDDAFKVTFVIKDRTEYRATITWPVESLLNISDEGMQVNGTQTHEYEHGVGGNSSGGGSDSIDTKLALSLAAAVFNSFFKEK